MRNGRGTRSISGRSLKVGWFAVMMILAVAGCGRHPWPQMVAANPTTSFNNPESTTLGRIFSREFQAHPGQSGFALMRRGDLAFRVRNSLIFAAEQTLDLQYFIWELDTSGKILAHSLLHAADRGVRVRLLVDDLHAGGKEITIAALDRHPNIEVRLFNPFAIRNGRTGKLLTAFPRLNRRMHNKAFIADNAIAIVGGRNVGDVYFGIDSTTNFRDLDLAAAGPVVREISTSFDLFWNSDWAVPARSLLGRGQPEEEIREVRDKLRVWMENLEGFPYPVDPADEDLPEHLDELRSHFAWGEGKVLYDVPRKVSGADQNRLRRMLIQEVRGIREEILVEAAYFIPSPSDLALVDQLRLRRVRVRVLTNSLATNDVAAAHAGYAKYRRALLRRGVELYELRPDAGAERANWSALAGRSQASLHTKALVADREELFIGSFNFDPRSNNLNTEIGLYLESPELAERVAGFMDEGIRPENSYRLTLEKFEGADYEWLAWITRDAEGREVRYYSEPGVGLWQRFVSWFTSLLPVEEQL